MWPVIPVIPVYSFGNVLKKFLLKTAIFRMLIGHCTMENFLITVHVLNFPAKFLLMKFILLLLPEHLSRRLFTLPLAAPILSSV